MWNLFELWLFKKVIFIFTPLFKKGFLLLIPWEISKLLKFPNFTLFVTHTENIFKKVPLI